MVKGTGNREQGTGGVIPLLIVVAVLVAGMLNTGCAKPKNWYEPEFEASYSPLWGASVRSTRDDKATVKASYNPETKAFNLDAEVNGTASSVNASQVALMEQYRLQMVEFNEQLKTHGQNLSMALQQLNLMTQTLAGILNLKIGPDGIQAGNALNPGGAGDARIAALESQFQAIAEGLAAVMTAIEKLAGAQIEATKPPVHETKPPGGEAVEPTAFRAQAPAVRWMKRGEIDGRASVSRYS